MRVLDVTEFWSTRGGGVRSYLTDRAGAFSERGIEHVIVVPGARDGCESLHGSSLMTVSGPKMPYDPTYHAFVDPLRLSRLLARLDADVLEIHSPYVAALGALWVRPRPKARTMTWHSDPIDTFLSGGLRSRFGERAARWCTAPCWALFKALNRSSDAVFVAGHEQYQHLTELRMERLVHAPFGVDRSVFRPEARLDTERAASLFGAPKDAALLVASGRFAREKRWPLVLSAFDRLSRHRRVHLSLLGDGPERPLLERFCRGRTDVTLPGFVRHRPALAEYFASADLLVHGCPNETFGLSVAEALCCGTPVVVPDRGGAAQFRGFPGVFDYASNDASACAKEMERVLDQPRTPLRQAALHTSRRLRGHTESFDLILETYRQLLHREQA